MRKKIFNSLFFILFIATSPIYGNEQLYICTAANSLFFEHLLQLIGSIHQHNFDHLGKIAVFDLGLTDAEKTTLNTIEKVAVHSIEKVHPDIITPFYTYFIRTDQHQKNIDKYVPGWYAWKFVVLKQAIDMFGCALYLDAGTTVLKSLTPLFQIIKNQGYFLCTIGDEYDGARPLHPLRWGTTKRVLDYFNLKEPQDSDILEQEFVMGGIIGVSRNAHDFVQQLYQLSHHMDLFVDDGTAPSGLGSARHDQPLLTIKAHLNRLTIFRQDLDQRVPMSMNIGPEKVSVYITWNPRFVNQDTMIYSSRNDLRNFQHYQAQIRYKPQKAALRLP